eukprot:1196157-Prorocentrum_minimum.AAC.5
MVHQGSDSRSVLAIKGAQPATRQGWESDAPVEWCGSALIEMQSRDFTQRKAVESDWVVLASYGDESSNATLAHSHHHRGPIY